MIDLSAVGLLMIVGVGLLGWGVDLAVGNDQFSVVMLVFGGIGIVVGTTDIRRFRESDRNSRWIADHLGNMIGAYIATVTAVSVTNLTGLLGVVAWLWPTAIGVPLIWYWQVKYGNVGPFKQLVSESG